MSNNSHHQHQLYHNIYSLCSIQVRYTIAIASKPRDGLPPMQFQEVEVDLFNDGQLDEHFLTKVNRKGQVRVFPPVPSLRCNLCQSAGSLFAFIFCCSFCFVPLTTTVYLNANSYIHCLVLHRSQHSLLPHSINPWPTVWKSPII